MENMIRIVINMEYINRNPNHNCHNRTFQIKIQETLQKFSLFDLHFSSQKPQILLDILDPHASLIKNHHSFGAIHQEFKQFKSIIKWIGFGN